MDIVTWTNLILIIPFFQCVFVYGLYHIMPYLCLISIFVSFLYHFTQENHNLLRKIEPIIVKIFAIVFLVDNYRTIYDSYYIIFIILANSLLYYLGKGRECNFTRTSLYIFYHSAFHIMTGYLGYFILISKKNFFHSSY